MAGKKSKAKAPFHRPSTGIDPRLCFILMPFRPDLDEIYQLVVKPVISQSPLKMKCLRADEIYSANEIIKDVWEFIVSARVIIADLTYRNPNVMYELGISHALGKKAILLTQNIDDVPFDLRHIRCIVYDKGPRGVEKLKQDLKETVQSVLSEPAIDPYSITGSLEEVERLKTENQQLAQEVERQQLTNLIRGRDEYEPFEELAKNARDIFIAGPTLAIVAMKQRFFRDKLSSGCTLRFVIPEPDPNNPPMTGLFNHWHTPPAGFTSEVRSALVNFRILKQSIPPEVSELLGLRYTDYAITLSLFMIDGNTDTGYIQVELLPYNTSAADRPHFVLRQAENPYWYSFFRDRCNQMWDTGLPLDINSVELIK